AKVVLSFVAAIQWDGFQPLRLAGWIRSGSAVAGGAAAALCPAGGPTRRRWLTVLTQTPAFVSGGRAPDRIRGQSDETEEARTVTRDDAARQAVAHAPKSNSSRARIEPPGRWPTREAGRCPNS